MCTVAQRAREAALAGPSDNDARLVVNAVHLALHALAACAAQ